MKRKHEEHKTFMCAVCGRGFAFKGELTSHNRNVHDKNQRPKKQFKCQFCNKIYKCAKSVTVHERSAHTGIVYETVYNLHTTHTYTHTARFFCIDLSFVIRTTLSYTLKLKKSVQ